MAKKFDIRARRDRSSDRSKNILPLVDQNQPRIRRAAQEPLKALTMAQSEYMAEILGRTLTFGLGPAGTGKTYVCGRLAAKALQNCDTDKLIITRPAVEAGESLGFLPGELDEKFEPFFAPFRDVLEEALGAGHVQGMIAAGRIEALPLAHMRGHTFKHAWVILDEAQNTTPAQMKLFLTRIGQNAKVIINGDLSQKDIPGCSGLLDAIERLAGLEDMAIVEFSDADIVRSGIVQRIVERYRYNNDDADDSDGVKRYLRVA
ncbi:PhoH family protein [Inquilinus sp. OTU3971]|uniref:PhoH family protein n=1 Tax=Inquilinus sp. OTU3971 TaxID=3043855 RepID=UPI00313E2C19